MQSSLLLQALAGCNRDRPPVWLMRQAGRYLPEYQALRGRYTLSQLFCTPELAAQVTLLPRRLLQVDASILFSDITIVALALGFSLDFQEGPQIAPLLQTAADVQSLSCLDPREVLAFVGDAAALAISDVPLIGFCGGPFTVASYLIEKHTGSDLPKTKQWLYRDPASFHLLLEKITQVSIPYLQMQVERGAAAIQIFDSWAHVLTDVQFHSVCLPYWKRLIQAVSVPAIVFARGNAFRVASIAKACSAAISLDWQLPLAAARTHTSLPLQGNLDPDLLFAPLDHVEQQTLHLLHSMRKDPSFIVNLGHGVKPHTPVEAVQSLIDTVRSYAP